MNYHDCLEILKDNYCRGGETDKDGLYRFISGGNLLYLANKTGGWCFRYTGSVHAILTPQQEHTMQPLVWKEIK